MTQPHNKKSVQGALLEYADADQIDIKSIAEKFDIILQVAGAYLRNLKSGPNIYHKLLRAGYDAPVIPGWVHRGTSVDQPSADKTSLEQAETQGEPPLGEGAPETQPGGAVVQPSAFKSRVLPDEELSRLGIIKMADGSFYKASDGPGGAIVLRPVDPNVAAAASRTGLDIGSAISEAATEEYKLNVMAIARKVAQGQASSSCS